VKRYFQEISVGVTLLVVLVALAIFAPGFYQPQPLLSLATREAPSLIMACGMALIIIGRQIDISVGSQFSVCSVCAALLVVHGWPLWAVVPAAAAIGGLMGAFNGAMVAWLRLPSIVVTLATMVTLRQGLNLVRQGEFVNLPDGVQWFGLSQAGGQWVIVLAALAVMVLFALVMRHLAVGRCVYAVGSDAEAARLAGIRPQRVTFFLFVLMGALAGVAATLNLVQSPQVQPAVGTGIEMKIIAAVVVGGVAISGGRGNLWGAFMGLMLLACVSPALIHLHVEAYWEKAIQGAIILLAVVAEGLRRRNQTH